MTEQKSSWRSTILIGALLSAVVTVGLVCVLIWVGSLVRERQQALEQAVREQEQMEKEALDREEHEREEQEQKSKEERPYVECRRGLQRLTETVEAYKLNNNVYPETLDALLQPQPRGGLPFFSGRQNLTDPWGKPFRYDITGPSTNGKRPDIWSNTPRGKLGNWPSPPVPKP